MRSREWLILEVRSQHDRPSKTATAAKDDIERQRRRAVKEVEDQWVNDFIKRLNCTIDDIGRKA
jgi:hypothetical protein